MTAVANFLFIDKLLLRMGLNMQQFGFIKGATWFLPAVLNLFLSPMFLQLNRDREIIAAGYILRVGVPYLLLLLPFLTSDKNLLSLGCGIVLLPSFIFPIFAKNRKI